MSQPSLSVAGNLRITAPVNEPVRDYRPGSPEAVALHAELDRVRGEVRELRNVINGERLPLGATVDVVAPHDHAHVLGRYSPADTRQVDAAIRAALAARADWSRTPVVGPGSRAAARRRARERQVPQRAPGDDHARPVEDLPPGRDRRRLRAGRLLPLQRPLRRPDLRDPAPVAARGVQLPRPARPGGLRPGDHPVQLHRDRRQPPDHRGADGQHGGLEAVGEGRAQQRRGHAGPRGGRPAARRDQPRARLRGGRRRPGAGRRELRRCQLHRIDRGVPRPVEEDREQHRPVPQLPAHRR